MFQSGRSLAYHRPNRSQFSSQINVSLSFLKSQGYNFVYIAELLKVVTNEKGQAVGEVVNHYMLVGEVVLDIFLSF